MSSGYWPAKSARGLVERGAEVAEGPGIFEVVLGREDSGVVVPPGQGLRVVEGPGLVGDLLDGAEGLGIDQGLIEAARVGARAVVLDNLAGGLGVVPARGPLGN